MCDAGAGARLPTAHGHSRAVPQRLRRVRHGLRTAVPPAARAVRHRRPTGNGRGALADAPIVRAGGPAPSRLALARPGPPVRRRGVHRAPDRSLRKRHQDDAAGALGPGRLRPRSPPLGRAPAGLVPARTDRDRLRPADPGGLPAQHGAAGPPSVQAAVPGRPHGRGGGCTDGRLRRRCSRRAVVIDLPGRRPQRPAPTAPPRKRSRLRAAHAGGRSRLGRSSTGGSDLRRHGRVLRAAAERLEEATAVPRRCRRARPDPPPRRRGGAGRAGRGPGADDERRLGNRRRGAGCPGRSERHTQPRPAPAHDVDRRRQPAALAPEAARRPSSVVQPGTRRRDRRRLPASRARDAPAPPERVHPAAGIAAARDRRARGPGRLVRPAVRPREPPRPGRLPRADGVRPGSVCRSAVLGLRVPAIRPTRAPLHRRDGDARARRPLRRRTHRRLRPVGRPGRAARVQPLPLAAEQPLAGAARARAHQASPAESAPRARPRAPRGPARARCGRARPERSRGRSAAPPPAGRARGT